eukprot:75592-Hanusia_phi.AAC.1
MQERALFTDKGTTVGLHDKIDEMKETLNKLVREIAEANEEIEREVEKLSSVLKQIPSATAGSEEFERKLLEICSVMSELSTVVRGSCSDCMRESSEKFKGAIEGCKQMQHKEQEQLLVQVLEEVRAMQRKLDNVESQITDIQVKLDEAINNSRSAVHMLNQMCLAQSNTMMAPYLVWIYPAERKKGRWGKLLSPREWIYDTIYIHLICPVSLKVCKERFEIKLLKDWFKRALPYLKAAMLVLKLVVTTANRMGLPLPPFDLMELPSESRELQAVTALSACISEVAKEENIDLKPLEDQFNAWEKQQHLDPRVMEHMRSSNKAMLELMESIDR